MVDREELIVYIYDLIFFSTGEINVCEFGRYTTRRFPDPR
jgi:hypothetical protein